METVATKIADFVSTTQFEDLPSQVIDESKRLLLDSIGVALAGVTTEIGKIGVGFGRRLGGAPEATILGTGDRVSCFGAAFANAELMHSIDYEALLMQPPGHVSPYVIAPVLAAAEMAKARGKELILANALAHEIALRVGSALSFSLPVFGMSCCVFGGVSAVGKLLNFDRDRLTQCLGIAGLIAPTQSLGKWIQAVPPPTIRWLSAGWISQAELTAAFLAESGHTGDPAVFEGDYGFWKYAGSSKWDAESVTAGLGKEWRFSSICRYKPYPGAGEAHAPMDCFAHIVSEYKLRPEEIQSVRVFAQLWVGLGTAPVYTTTMMNTQMESQMSVPYVFSVAAHGVKPGPEWHDQSTMSDPRILDFMKKVTLAAPEDYPEHIRSQPDPFGRWGRVDVAARGKVFSRETQFAKGDPFPIEARMSSRELAEKFRHNASRILPWHKIDRAADSILNLEKVQDVSVTMPGLSV